MKGRMVLVFSLVLALSLLMVVSSVFPGRPAWAMPGWAPTPISAPAGGENWVMVTYISTSTSDVDISSVAIHDPGYTVVDLSHVVDVNTSQTATCYLDFSNDGTNWDRGLTIFAAQADVTDMQQYNLFGMYSKITCTLDLDAANDITMTIMGKLHD